MDKESADKLRGMVRRAAIKNVNDTGETQRASVEVADGIWHDDVEVLQPFGVGSNAPEDGGLALVLSVGGDEGDLVVLPVGNPAKRLAGMKPGEVGLGNAHGDKIVLGKDGGVFIKAGGGITLSVGGVTFVLSAGGIAITGGTITHDGKNIGSTHKHGGVVPGAALTDVPA